ncbi:MAG TPA: aquaporin [Planctomycetota bacterium]|nr:aquaporin [Planctomycetota bacterium]
MKNKLLAECLGTFALVLAGTGAIVVDGVSGGAVTHLGVALTFGFIVFAMIQCFGDVSGAHLNPAVTLGFVAASRMPRAMAIPYVAAQCLGACAASVLLFALFPGHATLGATLPAGSDLQSFGLEVAMTWLLMLVILSVSAGSKERGWWPGIAIGAVVGLEALFGGPVSGASMNPARSLAPALVSWRLEHLWIYLVAPFVGALLAVPACRLVQPAGCCDASGGRACP